jgi:hypothetical protein
MAKTVAFETKCYEGDWEIVVTERYLRPVIENCRHSFDHTVLYLNNFTDYGPVTQAAEQLVAAEVIDEYCVVEEHATSALEAFDLTRESFGAGYYYSIAELVGIHRCTTDYLLHFSGDSRMEAGAPSWVDSAIDVMERRPDVLVANPIWGRHHRQARREALAEDTDWYYSYGFSDQCYLVQTRRMQNKGTYNESHPDAERYPIYGGELFEKRVDAYMRNHQLHRITSKHASYDHKNHTKVGGAQWLKRQLAQKKRHLAQATRRRPLK